MKRQLAVGDVIDGFRLDQTLPAGGMSELWRVSRPDVAFPALMKIPRVAGGESPMTILGFEVEQMILARLKGAHVPRYVAAGDFEGPYIVMELIEGPSLKAKLDHLPLPYDEVAAIGARVATALHDLHRQHVIHLDLKPSNVIMRGDNAVLIDFGLSRHTQLPDLPAEEIGGPIGTGPYISPEQLEGVRNDPRSDLFALGVILYFLATGERPFGDPQTVRDWRRRLYVDPLPPRASSRRHAAVAAGNHPALPGARPRQRAIRPRRNWRSICSTLTRSRSPRARRRRAAAVSWPRIGRRLARLRPNPIGVQPRNAARPRQRADHRRRGGPHGLAGAGGCAARKSPPHCRGRARRAARLRQHFQAGANWRSTISRTSKAATFTSSDWRNWNTGCIRSADVTDHVTFHVLEAVDPAAALVEFARKSHADHIVIGARGSSALRRYLGSVSAQVVAEALCTVTVVRATAEARMVEE